MTEGEIKLVQRPDELSVSHASWLSLKDLRDLVTRADELNWSDASLVSVSSEELITHPTLADYAIAKGLMIEGGPEQ